MFAEIAHSIKGLFPSRLRCAVQYKLTLLAALLAYPRNSVRSMTVRRERLPREVEGDDLIRRAFSYDRSLLPNRYIAEVESSTRDAETAVKGCGRSIGYPSWNLLYYSLLCSLSPQEKDAVIVETGTDLGFSAIILAQALKDSGARGRVRTVDNNAGRVEEARRNVGKAGLSDLIEFNVADSLEFLSQLVGEVPFINFAFLDGGHEYSHVIKEFSLVYPLVTACRGTVYFDNTIGNTTGVARALYFIRHAYPGNMIEFRNCSWLPPGNAIWQPDW